MRLQETLAIRHQPEGVRHARDAVRSCLDRWDVAVDRDLVVLLVSEAVTNAVRHGAPPSTVWLTWDATTLHVSVRDSGGGSPAVQPVSDGTESGRGLAMVAALADRWGIDAGKRSKAVWFEVGRRPRPDVDDQVPAIAEAIAREAAEYLLLHRDEVEPV